MLRPISRRRTVSSLSLRARLRSSAFLTAAPTSVSYTHLDRKAMEDAISKAGYTLKDEPSTEGKATVIVRCV